jgi:dephospho-CoA kinase
MKKRAKIVAVTGGIGSGQSTVSRMLAENYPCKVVNADLVAKQIIDTNPDVKELLAEAFGAAIFDKNGILLRREFAALVFTDKNKIQQLNTIVHPYLVSEFITAMEDGQASDTHKLIVIDAALIYEMAIEKYFDFIVVVYAPKQQRIKRVQERDRLTRSEILHRMENQFDLNEKRAWADFVVDNSYGMDELTQAVEKLYQQLISAKISQD